MKLTNKQLRQIIKEELEFVMNESQVKNSIDRLEQALVKLGHVDLRAGKTMTQIDREVPKPGAFPINGTSIYVGRDENSKGVRIGVVDRNGEIMYDDNEIAAATEKKMLEISK